MALMASGFGMGKSFFLGKLFREVIFPESELVGSNRKYEAFIRWSQRAGYIALTILVVTLLTIWTGSFTRNEMYMHEVSGYIADFNAEQKRINAWSTDLQAILPSLNALAKASAVYNKDEHPWLSGLGMYDSSVDDAADKAYDSQLQYLFLPRLLKYMEFHLKGGSQEGDLYDNFRTYLMFNKIDYMDKSRILDWFGSRWQNEFAGREPIRNELKSHLAALLNLKLKPAELNWTLVASIRNQLLQVPVAQRIYNRIRTNPDYTSQVNLINEFGESVRSTFVMNENVNQVWPPGGADSTRAGAEHFYPFGMLKGDWVHLWLG